MLCVFLCSHRLSAHSVSWLAAWGVVCVLLFLHRWSALVGWLSVLECAFWGVLPLFGLLHLFSLLCLFVTPYCPAFLLTGSLLHRGAMVRHV